MKYIARAGLLALILLINACKPVPVSHWFPVTPQEKYERDLYKAKLDKTPAGQTWLKMAGLVLHDTLFSTAPYQERFFLGDSTPAQALRIRIPEGRRLVIRPVRNAADTVSRLFVELYKIKKTGKPQRLEYFADAQDSLTFTDHDGDTLLLRMQTGVNEKLTVALSLTTEPTLLFPVAGHGMSSVISFWGADRDAGARLHEGIDIKAKRGTPVVSGENGFVTQAGTNNLGGKVVSVSSLQNPYSLYYAHLDSQLVSAGTRVTRGDTLGWVGNTGNAITTTPHLHFGIYARGSGAVNPLPFINDRKEKLPGLPEKSVYLGDTVRIRKKVNLFASPQFGKQEQIASLAVNAQVKILGEMARGYRVALENGTIGYIPTVPLRAASREVSQNVRP